MSTVERRVEMADRFARLETKMDTCIQEIRDGRASDAQIAQRVGSLETFRSAVLAVTSFITLIGGTLWAMVAKGGH